MPPPARRTPRRLAPALLALLAAVAGGLYVLREPADGAAPASPALGASPLALPLPASAAAIAAAPAPRAATAAPAAPPPAPRIGSEGFGPHIERAHAGSDAAAAWEAVQWLRRCASTEARRDSFEQARNQGVAPEMTTQLMVEADAEARRCQTVTAQHRALLPELAARAVRAGVPEAASAYAHAVFAAELGVAQRQQVAGAMKRDAEAGHAASLLGAALSHEAWGVSDGERLAYLAAYAELQPGAEATLRALLESGAVRFGTPPTPQQQAEARLAGQQIAARARTRPP